jgi:hypothetical protein
MSEVALCLAEHFEAANASFIAYIQGLAPGQWLTRCEGEERTVAALSHHVAWGYAIEIESFRAIAASQPLPPVTLAWLNDMNARNGEEYAECSLAETVELLQGNAARAAGVIRGLSDEHLQKSGRYLEHLPEMTVQRWLERVLLGHIAVHRRSIEEALAQT